MDPITLWIETKWAFLMSLVSQNIIPYFFELYSFVLFFLNIIPFSTVQSLSCVWLFCNAMDCSMPGFSVLHQLPELAQTHVLWVGDAIQPSHPLSSPSPISIFLSIRVFSKESVLHVRWPKYWSFSYHLVKNNYYYLWVKMYLSISFCSLLKHH